MEEAEPGAERMAEQCATQPLAGLIGGGKPYADDKQLIEVIDVLRQAQGGCHANPYRGGKIDRPSPVV